MDAGAVVREALDFYRAHWRTFVPLALVVYVILGLVSLVLGAILGVVGGVVAGLLGLVGYFWLQGAIVEAVSDVRDGRRDLSIRDTFERVRGRLPAILPAGILAAIGIALGFVLLIVPGLFLLTIWCLIVPVIVLEGRSAGESFGRSRELVRGHGWSVFGVIAMTIAIALLANIVLAIVTAPFADWLQSFLQSVISNTVVAPFVGVAWTLVYYALARPVEATATPAPEPAA